MNIIDKAIAVVSPQRGLVRARARYMLRGYDAASIGRRASAWNSRSSSANSEISPALKTLRARSRDLVRNTPHSTRMIDITVASAIGNGIRPVCNTGSDNLDKKVSELWAEWQEDADVEGVLTFDAMQALAVRSMIESGEFVLKFVDGEFKGSKSKIPLKLQLLEADFIDEAREGVYGDQAPGTRRSRLGVGLGEYDRRTGLWLWKFHPGEMVTYQTLPTVSEFNSIKDLMHVYKPLRPGQVRGVPWFAPVLTTARELADFMDAVMVKARVEACFSGFITNTDDLEELMQPAPDSMGYTDPNNPDAMITELQPGLLKELRSGQDVKFAAPTTTSQVEPILMTMLQAMAAGIGCTYDQATGDLRQANYSSLRAGKLDFRALIEQLQFLTLIPRMLKPVWNRFISRAILAGALRQRAGGYPVSFVTPMWPSINPKTDLTGELEMVRAGRMTPQEFYGSWGNDWRKNVDDFKEFFEYADKAGMVFDIDARKVSKAGQQQQNAPGQDGQDIGEAGAGFNGFDETLAEGSRVIPFPLSGGSNRQHKPLYSVREVQYEEAEHPRDPAGLWTNKSKSTPAAKSSGKQGASAKQSNEGVSRPDAGSGEGGNGLGGVLSGVGIKTEHAPSDKTHTIMQQTGATPVTFFELGKGGGKVFHDAVDAAAKANPYGKSLTVFSEESYEGFRTFLSEDGKVGFALDGDDIISLFKHPDSSVQNAAASALAVATAEGGKRLECFDTTLPFMYGSAGFRAVARIKWDETQAPKGWDKNLYKQFNNGEPDVVFMVYDPEYVQFYPYERGAGRLVGSWGDGVSEQMATLKRMAQPTEPPPPPPPPPVSAFKDLKEQFEKAEIHVGNISDVEDAESFYKEWTDRMGGQSPADFKKEYFGGYDGELSISVLGRSWEFEGTLRKDKRSIATLNRTLNWGSKEGHLDYFKIISHETGGKQGSSIGKKVLAAHIGMLQRLGFTRDTLYANIDVGGYAWAKYGYIPDRTDWRALTSRIRARTGRSERLRGSTGSGVYPESWDMIGDYHRERIQEEWMRSTYDEFYQSEVENWRESGGALDEAKFSLADNFSGDDDWARDALVDLHENRIERGEPAIPYTTDILLESISIEYDRDYEGRGDPDISFDDNKLREPSDAPPKEQLPLPGFDQPDLSTHLTDKMREEITETLTTAFNDKAEHDADDVDPPDYFDDNVREYQKEYWDSMEDDARFEWAERNRELPELEIDPDEEEAEAATVEIPPESSIEKLLNSNDGKAIWAVADSSEGKDLLLNTSWSGALNFGDKEAMDRFNAYVAKGKEKPDVKPLAA